jgi:RNA ligase (TIGR02306 family)
MTRKLVTVKKIENLRSIPDADMIEAATVGGWQVVVKKGQFQIGDPCIFFEIDSFLPIQPRYEFLRKGCYKNIENLGEGFRLRTIKLKKQISQGLVMSLDDLGIWKESDHVWKYSNEIGNTYYISPTLDEDLSDILKVVKYEPPLPANLVGKARGNFPSFVPKTDQERIQNLINDPAQMAEILGQQFEITLKLDGTSATYIKTIEGELHACSRNLDLKLEDESSLYVKHAKETGILDLIPAGYAIQGELYGNGIQGNHDKLSTVRFYVFDIFNITTQEYLSPIKREMFFNNFLGGKAGISHVPVLAVNETIPMDTGLEAFLALADATKSLNNDIAEGIVFKRIDGKYSFKAISNKFLLGEK